MSPVTGVKCSCHQIRKLQRALTISDGASFLSERRAHPSRPAVALRRIDRPSGGGVHPPGSPRGPSRDDRRQPPAELSAARARRFHVAARAASVLEPVHLQRHPAPGRLQRGRVLSLGRALRDPARSRRLDRHRGDPVLADRGRDVPLPARPGAVDRGLRPGRPHVRVLGRRAGSGQPRRHDGRVRVDTVHAPGGAAHRQGRALALVGAARRRIRAGDLRGRTRGDARRGPADRRLRRRLGRIRSRPLVARADPLRGRCGVGPGAGRGAVAARASRRSPTPSAPGWAARSPHRGASRPPTACCRSCPTSSAASATSGKPCSSRTTTCPRSRSTWGSFP